MRLLFYNNYDMQKAWQDWQNHLAPDQHLFGVNHLMNDGIQVKILRHKSGFIREASRYGNLNQQTRVALTGFLYPVVYCGFFSDTGFLALLRHSHCLRSDLVSVLHTPLDRNAFNARAIKAHWRISVLSRSLYTETISTWPEFSDKFVHIPWGADLRFYPEPCCDPKPGGFILSIGATRRDFKTLLAAARKSAQQFVICTPGESGLAPGELPKNVTLHEKSYLSYPETLRLYRDCMAVAVPLDVPENYRGTQIGISSLLEAMAMGRPVIMTRHLLLDIDIEKEQIGYWTRAKDVNSWINAIAKMGGDPKQAAAMGRRGRLLCEEHYNTARYGMDLCRLLQTHPKSAAHASRQN